MNNLILVACGGALGAVGRYLIGKFFANNMADNDALAFPFATLIVNIVGSFALAYLFAYLSTTNTASAQSYWLFFGVGLLGAFTTFSTFSLEFVLLAQQGEWVRAALYASLSFVACIMAVAAALWLKSYS